MVHQIVRSVPLQYQQTAEERWGRLDLFLHLEKVVGELSDPLPISSWWLGCDRPKGNFLSRVEWFWVGPAIQTNMQCEESPLLDTSRKEIWSAIQSHIRGEIDTHKIPEDRDEVIIHCLQAVCRHKLLYGKQVGLKYPPEHEQQAFMIARAIRYCYRHCYPSS